MNRIIGQQGLLQATEQLQRRILHIDRFAGEPWQRIALLYRLADSYGKRVYPRSLCGDRLSAGGGCTTGECCGCRPDVFALEEEVLDRLPHRTTPTAYCPFFNRARKTCGIYGVRPFACRIYFNPNPSRLYCRNPDEATLRLFENLKRHLEPILGPYRGGYRLDDARANKKGSR